MNGKRHLWLGRRGYGVSRPEKERESRKEDGLETSGGFSQSGEMGVDRCHGKVTIQHWGGRLCFCRSKTRYR